MPLDQELNSKLKKVWAIHEKLLNGEYISNEERGYYNDHLSFIQGYYASQTAYWSGQPKIK